MSIYDVDDPGQHTFRTLYRGVVTEVLNDMSVWLDRADETEYSIEEYATKVNPGHGQALFESAPRNSLLVRIISDGYDHESDETNMVCYPFFPPHFAMPIKPGEQVWVFVEDEDGPAAALGYWLCRISGPSFVDDINFTHVSRADLYTSADSTEAWAADADKIEDSAGYRGVDFPNGTDVEGHMDLADPDEYEHIFSGSRANQSITYEAVPRFTKRPGDLVLQGSNNTLICLGEDRGYIKEDAAGIPTAEWSSSVNSGAAEDAAHFSGLETPPPAGAQDPNERVRAGSIDIVVGRGRFPPDPDAVAENTSCRIIENSRKYLEADKNPVGAAQDALAQTAEAKENRLENPAEGDPDFHADMSRIYVTMNTLPDINFALNKQYPQVPPAGNENDGEDIAILEELAKGIGQAAIVLKSDEIRIIARQEPLDDPKKDPKISGSIKIIKEGVADDEDGAGRACIIMQPDGVIMIDGPKIVIGSGIEKDNGEGAQVSIGLGANDEPMVLGAQLLGILSAIIDVLDNHIHPSGAGPTSPRAGGAEATAIGGFSNTGDNITDLKLMLSKVGKLL